MEKADKKIYELLKLLNKNEQFNVWRDLVAKPIIEQIENDLTGEGRLENLSEANLKSKVMYLNLVKHLFYRIFDQANALLELEEESEKK